MKPIKTEEQYGTALARVYELMQTEVKENTIESDELEVLSILIKAYENQQYHMNTQTASYWIQHLNLQPHPEGGYYKETYRSQQNVTRQGSSAIKQACTSIYYLLADDDFSGFHRILSDEIWYFHKGAPLFIHVIDECGIHTAHELSDDVKGNLSLIVKAGLWFASEIPSKRGFTLASCAVAPGFDFKEFEMAKKDDLIALYPQYTDLTSRLCRK
jgi:predicted cupin superfamily sugar epimerase